VEELRYKSRVTPRTGNPEPSTRRAKGKGQSDFSDWPLFMPATTYSPTHFRVQYHWPSGAMRRSGVCSPIKKDETGPET
jgi:hypothetical protein